MNELNFFGSLLLLLLFALFLRFGSFRDDVFCLFFQLFFGSRFLQFSGLTYCDERRNKIRFDVL